MQKKLQYKYNTNGFNFKSSDVVGYHTPVKTELSEPASSHTTRTFPTEEPPLPLPIEVPRVPAQKPENINMKNEERSWPGAEEDLAQIHLIRNEVPHHEDQHETLSPTGGVPNIPFDPGQCDNQSDGRRDSLESNSSSVTSPGLKRKREGKDEKLAREKGLTVFISVRDIINIPMDEFNETLERMKTTGLTTENGRGPGPLMTEDQVVLAREIRRRGKNKNAAQDCRKRAQERIEKLRQEVEEYKNKKRKLHHEESELSHKRQCVKRRNDVLEDIIYRGMNVDRNTYMLENNPETGIVNFRRIPHEIIQGPPPLTPLSRPPAPSLGLDKTWVGGATLQKVTAVPAKPYNIYRPRPTVSLYPTSISSLPALPSVSLFPVNFMHPAPLPPNPVLPQNQALPPHQVLPPHLAIPSHQTLPSHQNFSRGILDHHSSRGVAEHPPTPPLLERQRRHEILRGGFIEDVYIKEEKEDLPEDLSIVSESDVAVIKEINPA